MIFTLEALYALNLFNNRSDDIPFLPLPIQENESRLEALRRVFEKGYADLTEQGLFKDHQATKQGVLYGYLLMKFCDSRNHIRYNNYLCAVDVDSNDLYTNVIQFDPDENQYEFEQFNKVIFLVNLYREIPFLSELKRRPLDHDFRDWKWLSSASFQYYMANNTALRITHMKSKRTEYDCIIVEDGAKKLFEFDIANERIRSISGKNVQKVFIQWMNLNVW